MTAEEIIDEMKQEIPYRVPVELEPFIKIAMQMYAREAIKADRKRVAAAATLLIEKIGGKVLTGQLKYIAYDGDHFEIDKSSILNLPIELPKTN